MGRRPGSPTARAGRVGRLVPVVALLVGSLALAAPSGAGTPTDPDPMTGAPAAGTCYDLTSEETMQTSAGEDPVACTDPHRLWVVGAVEAPAGVDVSSDGEKLRAYAQEACRPLVADAIGGDVILQLLSNYTLIYFGPDQADLDAGAHWVSCELAMFKNNELIRSTVAKPPRLTSPLHRSVARCANRRGYYVPCSEKHVSKAVYAKVIHQNYTDQRLRRAARTYCPRHVRGNSFSYASHRMPALKEHTFGLVCLHPQTN